MPTYYVDLPTASTGADGLTPSTFIGRDEIATKMESGDTFLFRGSWEMTYNLDWTALGNNNVTIDKWGSNPWRLKGGSLKLKTTTTSETRIKNGIFYGNEISANYMFYMFIYTNYAASSIVVNHRSLNQCTWAKHPLVAGAIAYFYTVGDIVGLTSSIAGCAAAWVVLRSTAFGTYIISGSGHGTTSIDSSYIMGPPSTLINWGGNATSLPVLTAPQWDELDLTKFNIIVGGFGVGASGGWALSSDPVISAQPTTQKKLIGETATFTVTATGTGTLHYQWYKNAATVGTDSNTLSLSSLVGNDNDSEIYVHITDDAGEVDSDTVYLRARAAVGTVWVKIDEDSYAYGNGSGESQVNYICWPDYLDRGLFAGDAIRFSGARALSEFYSKYVLNTSIDSWDPTIPWRINATSHGFTVGRTSLKNGIIYGDQIDGAGILENMFIAKAGGVFYANNGNPASKCTFVNSANSHAYDWGGGSPIVVNNCALISRSHLHPVVKGGSTPSYTVTTSGCRGNATAFKGPYSATDVSIAGNYITGDGIVDTSIPTIPAWNDSDLGAFDLMNGYGVGYAGVWAYTPLAPEITEQPSPDSISPRKTATLSVVTTGSIPMTHVWMKNGIPVVLGARASVEVSEDTRSSSLIITDCRESDQAQYSVEVTNSIDSVESEFATIDIKNVTEGIINFEAMDLSKCRLHAFEVGDASFSARVGQWAYVGDDNKLHNMLEGVPKSMTKMIAQPYKTNVYEGLNGVKKVTVVDGPYGIAMKIGSDGFAGEPAIGEELVVSVESGELGMLRSKTGATAGTYSVVARVLDADYNHGWMSIEFMSPFNVTIV